MRTFVIRLFVAVGPELATGGLRGVVEDVAGGRTETFGSADELVALLANPASTSRTVAPHTATSASERRTQ